MLAVGPWLFGRGSKGVVLGEFRKRREGESRGRIRLFNSSPPSPERVREKLGSSLLACLSIRGDDNRLLFWIFSVDMCDVEIDCIFYIGINEFNFSNVCINFCFR